LDLELERLHGEFVRAAIGRGQATACHDVSSGGLAVAVCEMALAAGVGARLAVPDPVHVMLFSEDQARYVIATPTPDALLSAAVEAGAGIAPLGHAGGEELTIAGRVSVSLHQLRNAHEGWMPAFMARHV
jgi:phosphoribosylformylglycinamidine synthase